MKHVFLFIGLFFAGMANAQQSDDTIETLFSNVEGVRGFGGIFFNNTQLNGQYTGMVGGEAAVSFNRKLNIGVTGQWLANDVTTRNVSSEGNDLFYDLGYGGLLIEPTFLSKKKVHFTVPIILGGGLIEEYRYLTPAILNSENFDDTEYYHRDHFFLVEPGLGAELNLTRFLRLSVAGSYRWAAGLNLTNTADTELNQFNLRVGLRAGWF